jgi:superfamily II DNA or RNA helicase/HKD family nuclease
MEAIKLAIQQAVITGFVDETNSSLNDYRPSILTNEPITNEKVLSTILEELRVCESFFLSVAFITSGGVASIMGTLIDLEEKGVKGKILVSEYLNFTEPEALRKLLKLKNVELKIARDSDFHSKGFLFTHASYYSIIIGSSNLTQGALTKNKEWNLKVTAHKDSELFKNTLTEFDKVFSSAFPVDEDYLVKYSFIHNSEKRLRSGLRKEILKNTISNTISPNQMQQEALNNLVHLRNLGKNKALLVSATGTGKTYLSAFDVLKFKPKKLLFLVHRKNIAQKAMETFQSIMDETIKMSLYTSGNNNTNVDFIFSTIQTFSRDEHLHAFEKSHFDYIIIDETHRASASSYQKILNHFTPKFLLGMTATPERTDGLDVFQLFDYNIAYEIRLHDALAQEMLVPFHYFGITDIEVNGQLVDENTSIQDLNRTDRVNHIIENLRKFGTDDGITRGLVFCSKNEESTYLSYEFNQRGYKTIALSGNSTEDERSRAIDLLETDDLEIKLDYIFSVDIFNEGIDIPRLNQVVMLRPTQSAIIFVQQLGRGLRIREGKSYLTVIDFIGNYQNNFLVPIALFGDKTYSKENLRKLVNRPEKAIVGASTIHFSRIIKEKIFHSIDTGKLQEKRKLVEEYKLLKGKIGRIPTMIDFINHGERDPYQYIQNYDSYYCFLLSQKENIEIISKEDLDLLKFLSNEVLNPIRYVDIHLFQTILQEKSINIEDFKSQYFSENLNVLDDSILNHAVNVINGLFVTEKSNSNLVKVGLNRNYEIIIRDINSIKIGNSLLQLILKKDILKSLLDLCNYSLLKLQHLGKEVFKNDFILNQRYSRKDVFRILCWDTNPVAQSVGGYMISKDNGDCALFINYHKEESISASTKYHDRFISRNEFVWMSKSGRTFKSNCVSKILAQNTYEMRIPLFVKKKNLEGIEFYYLGNTQVQKDSAVEKLIVNDEGKNVSVVEMNFSLHSPVEKSLYDYLLNSN